VSFQKVVQDFKQILRNKIKSAPPLWHLGSVLLPIKGVSGGSSSGSGKLVTFI